MATAPSAPKAKAGSFLTRHILRLVVGLAEKLSADPERQIATAPD
jgi:hypothetical protein